MSRLLLAIVIAGFAAVPMHAQERMPRVAVVNIGHVFNKYHKAIQFKADLEKTLEPYKAKGKELTAEIQECEAQFKKGAANEKALKAAIKKNKRLLEDMADEIKNVLGKEQENKLVELWKDVQAGIRVAAKQNNIDSVLGFGDPLEKELLNQFPNVNRKMQAMDLGGTVPVSFAAQVELSQAVIDVLNKTKKQQAKAPRLGTDRVAVVNIGRLAGGYRIGSQFKFLGGDVEPYQRELTKITGNIKAWEASLRQPGTADDEVVRIESKIAQGKRRIEEIQRALGKKQEENLVKLWKDIQTATSNYARVHAIDLVLEFADLLETEMLDRFPNVNRKMQAMDLGSTVPLFVSPPRDISGGVVSFLNRASEPQTTQVQITRIAYFFEISVGLSKANSAPVEVEKVKELAPPAHVAVVNVGHVFNNYDKAKLFKKRLEDTLSPYKEKGKQLVEEIKECEAAIKNGGANEKELTAAIKKNKRQLEDMSEEIQTILGKQQENNLVELWKEVQAGILTHSKQKNIDVVIGYGDPLENELLDQFTNVNRKMQAMDQGSTVPLFVTPRADVSEAVVELLNRQYRESRKYKRGR